MTCPYCGGQSTTDWPDGGGWRRFYCQPCDREWTTREETEDD